MQIEAALEAESSVADTELEMSLKCSKLQEFVKAESKIKKKLFI